MACVPTGMKTGVSMAPCGVCKLALRAAWPVLLISNRKDIRRDSKVEKLLTAEDTDFAEVRIKKATVRD